VYGLDDVGICGRPGVWLSEGHVMPLGDSQLLVISRLGSGDGVSNNLVGSVGASSSSFLFGTLRDLALVVTVAWSISMRRW